MLIAECVVDSAQSSDQVDGRSWVRYDLDTQEHFNRGGTAERHEGGDARRNIFGSELKRNRRHG